MLKYSIENISPSVENKLMLSMQNGLHLSFYFQGADCGFSYAQSQSSNLIQFQFSEEYLFSKNFDTQSLQHFEEITESNICCNTQMILHQIISTNYEDKYKEIFIESKALELLLCTLHSVSYTHLDVDKRQALGRCRYDGAHLCRNTF